MKKFFLFFCLISFLITNLSYASESSELTKQVEEPELPLSADSSHSGDKLNIHEAIELALEKNVDLNQIRKDYEIAKNNIKIANRLQNPSFEMDYGIGNTNKGNPQQIGISQVIELGKRSPRKKKAQVELRLSDDSIKAAEFEVKMDVREAFIRLAAAKSKLKNIHDQKEIILKLVSISETKIEPNTPDMDIMPSKIVLNQFILKENNARAAVLAAKYDFNKALNVNRSQEDNTFYDIEDDDLQDDGFVSHLTPSPKSVMPKFDDVALSAYEKRYDLKIAKNEIEAAKKNLDITIRQRIPDIEVGGGYAYMSSYQNEGNGMISGAYAKANLVNLPLLYNYSPEIKNAKLQLEQAQLHYESTKNKATTSLMSAYEKFIIAQKNLNYYNSDLISNSKEILKIAAQNYAQEKSDVTSLVFVQQSYSEIMDAYIDSLCNYYISWINFLREYNDETIDMNVSL